MGRKVHPIGFRLGIIRDHQTRWFASGQRYVQQLQEDRAIRQMVMKLITGAGISLLEIERFPNQVSLRVHTAKPGIIIGRKGANVNDLRTKLQTMTGKKVKIDIEEIERPELDAYLVSQSVAEQLEKRISYKRAMKQAVTPCRRACARTSRFSITRSSAARSTSSRLSTQSEK